MTTKKELMNSKESYLAPLLDVVEINIEKGFATSGEAGGTGTDGGWASWE